MRTSLFALLVVVTVACGAGPTGPTLQPCRNDKSLPPNLDPRLVKVIRECRVGEPVDGYTWIPPGPNGGGGYVPTPEVTTPQ
jgi:hypothetical protein